MTSNAWPNYDEIDEMSPGTVVEWVCRHKLPDRRNVFEMKRDIKVTATRARRDTGSSPGMQRDKFIKLIQRKVTHDRDRRVKLSEFAGKVSSFVAKIRDTDFFPGTDSDAYEKLQRLTDFSPLAKSSAECPILIMGESSTGKTSFINVLLDQHLLPTSIQSNTSAFVRIEYAETRSAIFYDVDGKVIDRMEDSVDFTEKIRPYLESKRDRLTFQCHSAVIYCNAGILKDGLQLIDSPGYGEVEIFNERLREYLEKAFGFIYIMKKTMPVGDKEIGGIFTYMQHLKRLMPNCQSGTVLFVLNMWDEFGREVSPDANPKSRAYTFMLSQLQRCWPGLDSSCLLKMSAEDALYIQREGLVAEDVALVLESLYRLWIRAVQNVSITAHGRMRSTLETMNHQINRILDSPNYDQLGVQYAELRGKLDCIDTKSVQFFDRSKQLISDCYHKGIRLFTRHLSLDQTLAALLASIRSLCPTLEDVGTCLDIPTIRKTITEATRVWMLREMDRWEEVNHFFYTVRRTLADDFASHFEKVVDRVSCQLTPEMINKTIDISSVENVTESQSSWNRFRERRNSSSDLTAYLDNTSAFISSTALTCIKRSLAASPSLIIAAYTQAQVARATVLVDNYQQFLKDRRIQLSDEVCAIQIELQHREIGASVYQMVRKQGNLLSQELTRFSLFYLQTNQSDIHLEDLASENSDSNVVRSDDILSLISNSPKLCKGNRAFIVKGRFQAETAIEQLQDQLDQSKRPEQISILLFKVKGTDEESILNLEREVQEYKILMDNPHSSLLRFYYCVKLPQSSSLNFLPLVTEHVTESLSRYLSTKRKKRSEEVSSVESDEDRLKFLLTIFQQIVDGLCYLHARGLVHLDLTLESIAITSDNQPKLTAFSRPRCLNIDPNQFTTSESVLTVCRLPPELINPEDMLQLYEPAADIYSLGIALVEAWTGVIPFIEDICQIPINSLHHFHNYLTKKYARPCKKEIIISPSLSGGHPGRVSGPPLQRLLSLAQQCWPSTPVARPNVNYVLGLFNKELHSFGT